MRHTPLNSKIYFTANTHFNDKDVFEQTIRQIHFFNVDDMNQEIIERWNNIVPKDAIVYHLGGFGDYKFAEKLNGRIILMYGEYEIKRPPTSDEQKLFHQIINRSSILLHNQFPLIKTSDVLLISNPNNNVDNPLDRYYLNSRFDKFHILEDNGININMQVHHYRPLSEFDVELFRRRIIHLRQ